MVKKNVIEGMISFARKSLGPSTVMDRINPCDMYMVEDYEKYVKQTMPPDEMQIFQEHCRNCLSCLKGILDQSENEALFQKTMGLMDRLETRAKENVFDVVIKVSKRIYEVITTTGEVLGMPALAPSRGEEAAGEEREPVRIIKEFDDPPISVQVSFGKQQKGRDIDLCISLLNRQLDEFISGIEVILTSSGKKQTGETNENGEAAFLIPGHGKYRVDIIDGGDKIANLNVTID